MVSAQTRMDTVETAFALARILRENKYLDAAFSIAKAGINLYEYVVWLRDLAIELDD